MPFYEYKCSSCGFELEEMQKMSDEPLKKCPNCSKDTLQKLIGTGGGLIFKGSGFYLTDYKKKSTSETSIKETSIKETSSKESSSQEPSAVKITKTGDGKKETKSPEKKTSSTDNKKSDNTKKEK